MPEIDPKTMGGTMRLGARPTLLRDRPDGSRTLAQDIYGVDVKRTLTCMACCVCGSRGVEVASSTLFLQLFGNDTGIVMK
jgi:hypothetical protein